MTRRSTRDRTRYAAPLLALALALLGLLLGPLDLSARPARRTPDVAAIDAYVHEQMTRHRIPGLALALVRGDELVHLRGYGTAGEGREMTGRTPLFIGSITKSLTALAVMQLVEQGHIELDAPVQAYLPWFRVADEAASRAITVRHLLHQTSGLSEATYLADLPSGTTLEGAVRHMRNAAPVTEPGGAFHYFNQNYTTLGLLVERVSGQPYGDYVREHILQPLGMVRSAATVEDIERLEVAQGHGILYGYPLPREQETSAHDMPEGGVVSTAEDMARYLKVLLPAAAQDSAHGARTGVLSAEGLATMMRPDTPGAPAGEGYAMGWIVEPWAGTTLVRHGGSLENYRAFAWLLPEEGWGFVVLINQNGFLPAMLAYSDIPEGIAALLLDRAPQRGLALRTLYWLLSAVTVIVVLVDTRLWSRIVGLWRGRRTARSTLAGALGAVGALLRAALFVALPYALLSGMGRGFTWPLGWTMAPTVILFLCWNVAMGAGQGLVRAWLLLRRRRGLG